MLLDGPPGAAGGHHQLLLRKGCPAQSPAPAPAPVRLHLILLLLLHLYHAPGGEPAGRHAGDQESQGGLANGRHQWTQEEEYEQDRAGQDKAQ